MVYDLILILCYFTSNVVAFLLKSMKSGSIGIVDGGPFIKPACGGTTGKGN